MHRFLLLILTLEIEQVPAIFAFCFGRDLTESFICKIEKVFNLNEDDISRSLRIIDLSITSVNMQEAFAYFCLAGKFINRFFHEYLVIPVFLFNSLKTITKDYVIRKTFYQSILSSGLKKHDNNLKEKILKFYCENESLFLDVPIEEIYLFGSILDDTYYDRSDIDIVIKVNNERDFNEMSLFLQEINLKHFNRKSDIQEYEGFKEYNSNSNLKLLFKKK